jgi:hypothetical protein
MRIESGRQVRVHVWLRHECGEDRVEVARARAAALARGRRLHLEKEQLLAAK